jgi:hypothetical protein
VIHTLPPFTAFFSRKSLGTNAAPIDCNSPPCTEFGGLTQMRQRGENKMTIINPSRRDVLKAATTLAAVSSIAAVSSPGAKAVENDPGLSSALGQVDQALRQAVNAQVVPGTVAIGANE